MPDVIKTISDSLVAICEQVQKVTQEQCFRLNKRVPFLGLHFLFWKLIRSVDEQVGLKLT